ncbi:MAG: hypothetical protein WAP17_09315, partial [Bacteroidales bacterium]
MKGLRIILSMALMLCVAILFSQNQPHQSTFKYGFIPQKTTKTINYVVKSTNETLDTVGLSDNFFPVFSPDGPMHIWGLIDADYNPIGYWFGVNSDSLDGWAQCYQLYNVSQVGIEGLLMIFGGKFDTDEDNNSSLSASVTPMAADVCIIGGTSGNYQYGAGPDLNNPYADVSIPISDIDTINLFTYKELDQTILVTDEFCIVADYTDLREKGDTAYLLSDDEGDGMGLHYTQYAKSPLGRYYWVSTNFGTGGVLDVNISLFAVVDLDYVNINSSSYFQGMQLTFPNITRDPELVIQFALKNASNTSIDIISLNGQL